MILYCTSNRPSLTDGKAFIPCVQEICRLSGFLDPHLCFVTEPLAGLGQYVYTVDVPEDAVTQYEYENEFRAEIQARYFALPLPTINMLAPTQQTYSSITGNEWNKWVVPVLDKRPNRATKLKGKWSVIWISKDGVVGAKVYRKSPDNMFLSLELQAGPEFNPERDYIVNEIHEEFDKDNGAGTKETWRLEVLAGAPPTWAIFPTAWQNWVFDKDVKTSAFDYIVRHAPQVKEWAETALNARDSKHNKAREWRRVAEEVGRTLSRLTKDHVDLGKFAGHSWTAVEAIPHRIAMRMTQHLPQQQAWVPPYPKPEFQHPDESGRVLLANLYGAYPKHGPGVDHVTQDRPFQRLEGELGGDGQ